LHLFILSISRMVSMVQEQDALLEIRVLDLSRVLAGPYCAMLLADMGAEIIKLEIPGKGDDSRQFPPFKDGDSLYYVNLNRGKKGITLNLKSPEGKRIFFELVKTCDVLLENFKPGTMDRLGLGFETLKKVNSRLVYASISGFGQTGPYSDRPGYDIIGQAMGGLMSITGWSDSPPTRAGTAIGDILSALFCCIGILSALQVRERTGEGQMVDVALVDSVFASLENIPQKYFVYGEIPRRIGNRYEFIYPYDSFKATDGWVIIGIANNAIWERFVEVTKLHVLEEDTRFANNPKRVENHESLKIIVQEWVSHRSVEDVVSLLSEHSIPACPIYDLKQAAEDPHIGVARGMTVELDQPELGKVKLMGNPIKMSETYTFPRGPAPSLGEDNYEILRGLIGLSDGEIKRLGKEGII
jgi:crotonobetainyl-CoA:carnitine CoA-transferase CaiB-like acyl-CoA transferase